jgi:hypothetical protein
MDSITQESPVTRFKIVNAAQLTTLVGRLSAIRTQSGQYKIIDQLPA